jgi:GT2 family glycosyltransferase
VPELAAVVVSYNTRPLLARCLRALAGSGDELVVVDNASTDGSAEMVRREFPRVRLLELPRNQGFAAAANLGIEATRGRFVLLLNADAWPADDGAIAMLRACAERDRDAAVIGPSLIGSEGAPQVSLIGLPTRWWTGAPAVSTTSPGRLARAHLRPGAGTRAFLVGAVLLLRRAALDQIGRFDTDFFMFGEEVDLCLRAQDAGWRVRRCPDAVFVHVGGAATRHDWAAMYREQLRGHLRLLAKHEGLADAERARRFLSAALRVRALLAPRGDRGVYRDAASWLRSASSSALIASPDRRSPDRTEEPEDRTSGSGG